MVGSTSSIPGSKSQPKGPDPEPSPPGAKSPESSARDGKRTVRPSGPTPAQLSPDPQTTANTPEFFDGAGPRDGKGVVAHNVSRGPAPLGHDGWAQPVCSSMGRSMPARQ